MRSGSTRVSRKQKSGDLSNRQSQANRQNVVINLHTDCRPAYRRRSGIPKSRQARARQEPSKPKVEERGYEKQKQLTDEEQMQRRQQAADRKRKREEVEKEGRRVKVKSIPRSLRRVREEFAVNIPPPRALSISSIRTPVVAEFPRRIGYDRRRGTIPFISAWSSSAPIAERAVGFQYQLPMQGYIQSAPGTLGYQMAKQGTTATLTAPRSLPTTQYNEITAAQQEQQRNREFQELQKEQERQNARQALGEKILQEEKEGEDQEAAEAAEIDDETRLAAYANALNESREAQEAAAQQQAEEEEFRRAQEEAFQPGLTEEQAMQRRQQAEKEEEEARAAAATAAVEAQEAAEAAETEQEAARAEQRATETQNQEEALETLQMSRSDAGSYYVQNIGLNNYGEPLAVKLGGTTIANISAPEDGESNVIATEEGLKLLASKDDPEKTRSLIESYTEIGEPDQGETISDVWYDSPDALERFRVGFYDQQPKPDARLNIRGMTRAKDDEELAEAPSLSSLQFTPDVTMQDVSPIMAIQSVNKGTPRTPREKSAEEKHLARLRRARQQMDTAYLTGAGKMAVGSPGGTRRFKRYQKRTKRFQFRRLGGSPYSE